MLGGFPVIFGLNPYKSSTIPEHPLGTIGVTPDGRKFRYALNNADNAAVAGELQQGRAEDTGDQSVAIEAAAIGATEVTTTGTLTVTANQYANGYLIATGEGGAGNGLYYRIKSHPAATAAVVTFQLYNPIEVALTASTQIDLVPNLWDGVIQNPTTASSAPAGVAMIAVPVSEYCWLQTGGQGITLSDGGATVGTSLVASNGTAGAVEDVASTTQAIVGTAMTGIASGEFGQTFLLLD